jgi:hypothetical protein
MAIVDNYYKRNKFKSVTFLCSIVFYITLNSKLKETSKVVVLKLQDARAVRHAAPGVSKNA